jgi:hypothetical protein
MWRLRNPARQPQKRPRYASASLVAACIALVTLIFGLPPRALGQETTGSKEKKKGAPRLQSVRWNEQQPGCTFSRGDDGKYRYGMWSGDVGIVLAVDAREVQIIRHRIEPIFGVFLTIRSRGGSSLDESPDNISLQFMKHFKVVQTSLDPDDYIVKIQADANAMDDETRREMTKHPDKKQTFETRMQEYQKSASDLIEFLGHDSLKPAHLNADYPEVSGWVFFTTKSKWLGGWKTQEEFVLRVPIAGKLFEFPFKLPPEKGELLLQKRP